MSDRDFLVVCAVRYCLGRQSYIVGTMTDYLKQNAAKINDADRRTILNDIDRQAQYGYGGKIDKIAWMEARASLLAATGEDKS